MGAAMQQMMHADPNQPPPPEMAAMMSQMGDLDYWFAHTADTILVTTETEPTILGQVLSGAGAGMQPPAFATPITEGADAVMHLSLGGMFSWMGGMMPMGMNPFGAMAQSLVMEEQGIWGSLTMLERGVDGSLIIPSSDIAALVRGVQSMQDAVIQQQQQQAPMY
jgi:hypothetical protein